MFSISNCMKLSQWAKKQGIQYGTALKWFHDKTLPVSAKQLSTGTILVDQFENVNENFQIDKKTFVYGRVSSANKKNDLQSQLELVETFCISKGWVIFKSIKEIASGMNDNRPKLNSILEEKNARVVVLYKDRLTRFGFNFIKKAIENNGGEVVVVHENKVEEDDLLKDFISVITSFCCRLYGARRGQAKSLKLRETLKE